MQGRRLETVTSLLNDETYSYTYNADGIRTSKTVNGVTREYILNGTQILGEIWSDGTTIVYIYDAEKTAIGMMYRESTYAENAFDVFFYERNLQGDIIAVYSADGTKLVNYFYDAWGNVTTTYSNGGANTAVRYNPFRYRGYYYDVETGFYYLNSRYYDPEIGRFINADSVGYLGESQDFGSHNLYAYCSNNPVMYYDPSGHFLLAALITGFFIGATIGFSATVYSDYKDDGQVFNGSVSAKDYVVHTIVGGVIGTAVAYAAPTLGASGFGSLAIAGGGTVSLATAKVAGATVAAAGMTFFAKHSTDKSNGYWGQKYGNDHSPDHIHLKGQDPGKEVKIGRDGKPLKGERPLDAQQRKAIKKLWNQILDLFDA